MDDLQRGDRPHRAPGRAAEHHVPAGARAAPRAEPGVLASATSFRGCTPCWRGGTAASAERAPAVLERLRAVPAFLDAARADAGRAALGVRGHRAGMLGGGGELIVQLAGVMVPETPALRDELQTAARRGARGAQALRQRAARRDRAQRRSARLRHRRGAVRPPTAPRARPRGRRARAVALRPSPPGGDRGRARGPRRRAGLPAVARAGGGAPERRPRDVASCSPAYQEELDRAQRFVAERNLVSDSRHVRSTWWHAAVPRLAGAVRGVRAAADLSLAPQSGRFYVTRPDPSLPPEARGAAAPRATAATRIPAMVAHEAYPGHHLQLVTAQELQSQVRRHLWTPVMVEGWALYCEQLMEEAGYYGSAEQAAVQLVNLLWRAVRVVLDVGLHTRGMTPAEAVDYMVEHLRSSGRARRPRCGATARGRPISSATPSAGASCSGCARRTGSAPGRRSIRAVPR